MVPFVVTGVFNVINNSRTVIIFQKDLEMFRFLVVESSLGFSDVKVIFQNIASNPSSHTRTVSTAHNYPKSFTKLVAGTAMIFTSEKRSEDSATGKRNISRPSVLKNDHSSAHQ